MMSGRDHIFISYATEDMALADWLARKLAAEGYAVWYDRLKLLGGEPWPQDIDVAIKTRTFRMLALLSKASAQKANPTRERTTAQAVAKELRISDFLIPLNVDGLRGTEIPWTVSDTNYISFSEGWAQGLSDVLKKLVTVEAPKALPNGPSLALSTLEDYGTILRPDPELLVTNVVKVAALPEAITRFETKTAVSASGTVALRRQWASHRVTDNEFLAFEPPPPDIAKELGCSPLSTLWRGLERISGVKSRNVTVSLIHASIECLMQSRGLNYSEERQRWYVPQGLTNNDWLPFRRPDGSGSRVLAVGERSFRKRPYRYHLSPSLRVMRGTSEPFFLIASIGVHFTDLEGHDLPGHQVQARRKHLSRGWYNYEWLSRTLALIQLFTDKDDNIRIGSSGLVIDGTPVSLTAPRSLDEHQSDPADLDHLVNDAEEDDEDDDL